MLRSARFDAPGVLNQAIIQKNKGRSQGTVLLLVRGKKLTFELPQIADAAPSDFKSFEEMERDYILRVLKAGKITPMPVLAEVQGRPVWHTAIESQL